MNKRAWEAAIVQPYGTESEDDRASHSEEQQVVNNEDVFIDALEEPHHDTQSAGLMKDILLKIYKYFGKAFSITKTKIIHGFETMVRTANDIKLAVNTDLDCTWLKSPTPKGSDTIGTWSKDDLVFVSKNNWVHEDFTKMIPRQLPIKITSGDAEKFFAKKFIAPPGKISLPSQVFTSETFNIPKSDTHLYEYWGRQGTLESEITHTLLDLTDDIIKALVTKFNTLDLSNHDDDTIKIIMDTFDNLSNVNRLAIQSNYRCKTFSIVSCVKAKTELRESVLSQFRGNNSTKEALRGSSFFTDSLFGPLPTSLTDNLNSCSSRSNAVLSPNFSFSTKTSNKRKLGTSSHQDYPPAKRSNSNRGNHNNRGGGYHSSNNASVSKYATSPHFHNRPHHPQRGRGQKKRGSKN